MLKNVLKVREVAEYLGVPVTTVYRLLKDKEIPAFRLGSDWRFNIESIDEWRRAREREVDGHDDAGAHLAGPRKTASSGDVQGGLVRGERSGSRARK